ncbi:hypothetical protein [Mesorhizobium australafricanum]|uniref:Uncharacterized protein n=1 Tax=Mesorhizobium australafricanum TaxID=3072311 RepID=A0ABU4WRM7_9HYPH|nr:hypothetical protein [Mesorhizobium sp. VK3E]MDX8438378.1 hypothetical protein [Mesorhizobium sp. VK3E]
MPNICVRAAAEGLPKVSRRKALAFLSSGVVAAVAAPAIVAQATPAASIQDALSACRASEEAYSICYAREAAISEALGEKMFPAWTAPGGIASIWSHKPTVFRTSKNLEDEIARKRKQIEDSFAAGLMNRPSYDRWMRDLEAQGSDGLASLREQEGVIAASGHPEAYKQTDEAFEEALAAFRAVMVLPCQTIEEVRAKAACLVRTYKLLGVTVDEEDFVACLSSLCEEA